MSRAGPPPAGAAEQLVALFNADRHAELETRAGQLTRKHPAFGLAWKMLGAARQMQGKDPFAALQTAAGLLPDDLELHYNLALSLHGAGRLEEAARSYCQVLELQPAMVEAHYSLGIILHALHQPDAALASFRRALELRPDFAEAHNFLGGVLQAMGRLGEAATCFRRTLEIRPEFAGAWSNLGTVLLAQGQGDESLACYRRALEIDPAYADVHFNLGNALRSQGQPQQAALAYQRALELKPDVAAVLNNLGDVLRDLGRLDEAAASCRRALEIRPDYPEACNNLANVLRDQGRPDEAIGHYRRALSLRPNYAGALNNLGGALQDVWQTDEAVDCYRRALAMQPDYAEAHNHLGNALKDLGDIDAALASFRRALELKPELASACDNLLFTLNYHPDLSAAEIFAAYRDYDMRYGLPHHSDWQAHANSREPARRLKIGYVSPDFRYHSVRHFLEPLLARHDKTGFEIHAYAELAHEDAETARYKSYVDHWIPTQGMDDETLAQRIRADRIDILVDLAGHTGKNRLPVFARKPALVSISWLGYGYTTGLSAIDYLLTDVVSAPAGSDDLFSEKPWRIVTPMYAYRPAAGMGEVSPLPAAQRGHITFGTLTRAVRINSKTIRVWSAILNQVERSRLVIDSGNYREQSARERLAAGFAAHGIERERLEIGYRSPPWDVLRGLDIGLDCFPHNSGTTLFESLYLGVPYISLAGRPSVGRLGSTILEGLGHPEWIAGSEQDYVDKAVALAANLPGLARLRAGLRAEMVGSPLMDEAGFARKLEAAYREMFAIWCSARE